MQVYSGEFIRQIVHKNIGGVITTPFWNYIKRINYDPAREADLGHVQLV